MYFLKPCVTCGTSSTFDGFGTGFCHAFLMKPFKCTPHKLKGRQLCLPAFYSLNNPQKLPQIPHLYASCVTLSLTLSLNAVIILVGYFLAGNYHKNSICTAPPFQQKQLKLYQLNNLLFKISAGHLKDEQYLGLKKKYFFFQIQYLPIPIFNNR